MQTLRIFQRAECTKYNIYTRVEPTVATAMMSSRPIQVTVNQNVSKLLSLVLCFYFYVHVLCLGVKITQHVQQQIWETVLWPTQRRCPQMSADNRKWQHGHSNRKCLKSPTIWKMLSKFKRLTANLWFTTTTSSNTVLATTNNRKLSPKPELLIYLEL